MNFRFTKFAYQSKYQTLFSFGFVFVDTIFVVEYFFSLCNSAIVPYSQLTLCAKWTYNVHNDRT